MRLCGRSAADLLAAMRLYRGDARYVMGRLLADLSDDDLAALALAAEKLYAEGAMLCNVGGGDD